MLYNESMKGVIDFFENFGANIAIILFVIGLAFIYVLFTIFDFAGGQILRFTLALAPIWLPILTFLLFFEHWLYFVRKHFDLEQGRVTLEIKIPQEVFKSPEAMELVLQQLYQTASPDNHYQTYWEGKHPPIYGLELVSRGGDVRFYMSVPRKKFKNMAEMHLYAQYPGIEVLELPVDYTAEIPWDDERFQYFSLHFNLKEADGLPIKTYFEYGLHMMPMEEEKVDPITAILDMLASIGPGEYYWIQILIEANRKEDFKVGSLSAKPDWKADAIKEVNNILEKAKKRKGGEGTSAPETMLMLTDTEKQTISAIERSVGKLAFNTTIRGMYIAKSENFLPGERIGPLITCWRAFDDLNRNSIGFKWRTDFDWNWWQDPSGKKRRMYKKLEFEDYRKRVYNRRKPGDTPHVFTTEELATIFHLPGKVATTPTLARIPSTRGEAPANLPIQS